MTKKQKILFYTATLVIVSLFILIVMGDNGLMDLRHLKKDRDSLIKENSQLKEDIRSLSVEIDRVKNDPAYIEAIARQELGMIGADEVLLKFNEKREIKNE